MIGLLSGRFDDAELQHHPHHVRLAPCFDDLSIFESGDGELLYIHLCPRRFDSHEFAFVGASKTGSNGHHVAFGDNVLDRVFEVRKRGSKRRGEFLESIRANGLGYCRIVPNPVVCKVLVNEVQVALVTDPSENSTAIFLFSSSIVDIIFSSLAPEP